MAEKTEKPTPKKIREGREKGQVAKSVEMTSGMQLVALLGYFSFEGEYLFHAMTHIINVAIDNFNLKFEQQLMLLSASFATFALRFIGGLSATVVLTTVFSVMIQIGPLLASKALAPTLERISVIANARQIFSMKSVFEFFKTLVKVLILSGILYYLFSRYLPSMQLLPTCDVACGTTLALLLMKWVWLSLIAFYVIFSLADVAFQRHNTMKNMMMSQQDIKQEHKNAEGDPEIKHQRKRLHQQIQSGSLNANVAKSTVVVRNPTHIAVCLHYQQGETPLPRVLEIGRDKRALHIVALAERYAIPVIEHIPLARALNKRVAPGDAIPPELFETVAHVLRLVMKLNYAPEDEESTDEKA